MSLIFFAAKVYAVLFLVGTAVSISIILGLLAWVWFSNRK